MSVKIEAITNFDQFLELRQPWNELVSQTEVNHAYMKHEWFECWIRNLGRLDNIMIPAVWSDNQLVAIAPMQISKIKLKGLQAKALTFLSSGISPRCNFIVHDSFDPKGLFECLFKRGGWDLVIVNNIESNLKTTDAYINYLKLNKKQHSVEPGRMSPFLTADPDWDNLWKNLSKSHRNNLNTAMNRIEKVGSFKINKITKPVEFANVFDQLAETSAKSWKRDMKSDLKSTPEILSFYSEFSGKTSETELFELWTLEIDGEMAAFDYHLKGDHALSLIRTDFDLKYKFYSPGNIIKLKLLKELFERPGIWEYDLGGEAVAYKTKWTDNIREHYNITASGSNIYGNLLMTGKSKILPFIKKLGLSSRE
jgi:hypothetical protein